MTQKEFYEKYASAAKANEAASGIPHLLTLAQAALESGWGAHAPQNNFFGIKASASWQGKKQRLLTTEYYQGIPRSEYAMFRAYDTPDECFRDHAEILNKRWPSARNYADPVQCIAHIQGDDPARRYATDPQYVKKITTLINLFRAMENEKSTDKK